MRKFFALILLLAFVCGIVPSNFSGVSSVEAKTKKAVKKIAKKRKAKKVVRKKTKKVRKAKKAPKKSALKIAGPSGIISQSYYLEEGADANEAEKITDELKGLGAEEVNVDVEKNVLQIKFNTKNLSAISILSKLKELGYTVQRID